MSRLEIIEVAAAAELPDIQHLGPGPELVLGGCQEICGDLLGRFLLYLLGLCLTNNTLLANHSLAIIAGRDTSTITLVAVATGKAELMSWGKAQLIGQLLALEELSLISSDAETLQVA